MDPELLKQRQKFLQRAAAQPTVSKRPLKEEVDDNKAAIKKAKSSIGLFSIAEANRRAATFDYKTAKASGSASFGILTKTVDMLKRRHLEGSTWGLTVGEILEELQIHDLSRRVRQWLEEEALPRNPKVGRDTEMKFVYKPPYKVAGKAGLLKLLRRHDLEGKGGILVSQLADCVKQPDKTIESLGKAVVQLPTMITKRKDKVVFFNDDAADVTIDEELRQLWRSVSIENAEEKKIEEYLVKHGIESMKDLAPKKGAHGTPKRRQRKNVNQKIHNEHLADGILRVYSTPIGATKLDS